MKTRNSLVSNSSSSSFIIIGIPIEISQLTKEHIISNSKSEFGTFIIGKQLCEGYDVFGLQDEKQLKFIQDYSNLFNKAFIKARFIYEGSCGLELKTLIQQGVDLQKCWVIGGRADQSSSSSIEDLIRNYEDDIKEEIEKEANRMLRKKYGVNNED